MNYADLSDGQFRQAMQEFKHESDQRHRDNVDRMDQHDKRLDALTVALTKNTETTNSIKQDTQQIVMLFRASQLGASVVKWMAAVGSALIIGYAAFKGLKG